MFQIVKPASASPVLPPTENPVHQMAEFMKYTNSIVELHQTGVRVGGSRYVAHQNRLRQLFAADAISRWSNSAVGVFTRAWKHVEINSPDYIVSLEDIPGFNRGFP